jgi:transcriptional regulator with XRE-family HTH domain
MWLDNLKELKKKTGMSAKQIADKTNLPERTVARIFSGDTDNPYVDTLRRIVAVLGGSLDDLFAESKIVVGGQDLLTLQSEVDRLTAENGLITAENVILKDKVVTLNAEIDLLRMKLEHKEEIINLHNYYKSVISGMTK